MSTLLHPSAFKRKFKNKQMGGAAAHLLVLDIRILCSPNVNLKFGMSHEANALIYFTVNAPPSLCPNTSG